MLLLLQSMLEEGQGSLMHHSIWNIRRPGLSNALLDMEYGNNIGEEWSLKMHVRQCRAGEAPTVTVGSQNLVVDHDQAVRNAEIGILCASGSFGLFAGFASVFKVIWMT